MDARSFTRVAPAAALVVAMVAAPSMSWAGGAGPGGPVFRAGGGVHGGPGGFRGMMGGVPHGGGFHALPPVSGVIHEHAGMRPSYSAYGHTATAVPFGGFSRGGRGAVGGYDGGYGHTATSLRPIGVARAGWGGYGHLDTGLRFHGVVGRRAGRFGQGIAFRERLRSGAGRGGYGYRGGYGDGFGGYGGYGDYGGVGAYAGAAPYGTGGPYGTSGTYGGGSYGTTGTEAGGLYGGDYASETPLAARFAEPPLAPSPGAPYSPGDRYAYAASEDLGPGPRVISVNRHRRHGCGCAPRVQPMIYRYGVGTAY